MADAPVIREAIAVFTDGEALEAAVSDLQSHGFDRAEISFISGPTVDKDVAADPAKVAADRPDERPASVSDTDIRQARNLGVSVATTIAAFAAAGFTVAVGAAPLMIAAATVVAAGGTAAIGEAIGKVAPLTTPTFLDAELQSGGVVLVVRLAKQGAEERALPILRERSGREVIVQDTPAKA
ncbi:MAG TPA: hypothetical protein VL993_01215 [Stellaceae bacterium]|nr:hypothetical protein [Stellaceae bacterium]